MPYKLGAPVRQAVSVKGTSSEKSSEATRLQNLQCDKFSVKCCKVFVLSIKFQYVRNGAFCDFERTKL